MRGAFNLNHLANTCSACDGGYKDGYKDLCCRFFLTDAIMRNHHQSASEAPQEPWRRE